MYFSFQAENNSVEKFQLEVTSHLIRVNSNGSQWKRCQAINKALESNSDHFTRLTSKPRGDVEAV